MPADDIPTLAELRLRRPARKRRGAASGPSATLFDFLAQPPQRPVVEQSSQPVAAPTPEPPARPVIWRVGELVRHVRGVIEREYAQLTVEGEISNWRTSANGHCYFTLKDGEAQLSVVLFRRQAALLRFAPKDGDQVRISGQLSIYEGRGQMQLVAEWMQLQGLGALLAAVQELKQRLAREGLFDNRRELPRFPQCIGVVTSLQGAALRDIVKVVRRRHAAARLVIYPAAVQGPQCAQEIAAGIAWFNDHPNIADVVLVARGGGSFEDLHGFDDERVVRAIAASAVPVITGIGHAPDSVLADLAADVVAPTPSAAAELLTAAQHRLAEHVFALSLAVERNARYRLSLSRQQLLALSPERFLARLQRVLYDRSQRADDAEQALFDRVRARLDSLRRRQDRALAGLSALNPGDRIQRVQQRLERMLPRLERAISAHLIRDQQRLALAAARMQSLNPHRVLERGYALVEDEHGRLVRSTRAVTPGSRLTTRVSDGVIHSTVDESASNVR